MPYTSHTGGFSECARDRAAQNVYQGDLNVRATTIEAAFDHDTAQADLFKSRAAHLASTFRPTTLIVRVSPALLGRSLTFSCQDNFVTVAAAVDEAVREVGRAAEAQARRQFATQLADHLAGIGS